MTKKRPRGIYLLPNIFTTLNMFCGFYAIVKIIQSFAHGPVAFSKAAVAVLLATIFDALDGRVARLTNTTSKFGVEYDSLADITSFGMAPALLVYCYALAPYGKPGWMAAFLYFGCTALRLARFNTQSGTRDELFFRGLPSPVAASFICSMLLLLPDLDSTPEKGKLWLVFIVYAIALFMVSNFRFHTFKNIDFGRRRPFSVMIFLMIAFVALVSEPIWVVFSLSSLYIALGTIINLTPRPIRKKLVLWIQDKKASSQEKSSPQSSVSDS